MPNNVIWLSVTDGSYGVCREDDLIVIREYDMTPDEQLDFWHGEGDEQEIIARVGARIGYKQFVVVQTTNEERGSDAPAGAWGPYTSEAEALDVCLQLRASVADGDESPIDYTVVQVYGR